MKQRMIGIDIGGTAVKLALLTKQGQLEHKWQIPTNTLDQGRHIPEDIVGTITHMLCERHVSTNDLVGIGVGVPGSISPDGQQVVKAVNLGWKNLALKPFLEDQLTLPVQLLNDANAAALGEMWAGAAKGSSNLLFVTLGTGVGGGIILNGQVVKGVHSAGGEIGHIPVASEEHRICGCGNVDCLETYASANGLHTTMSQLLQKAGKYKPPFTPVDIIQWAAAGDSLANTALAITCDYLGKAIAGIMNTIDVEKIVIGGGLSGAGAILLHPLAAVIDTHIFPQLRGHYTIHLAQLGNDAGVYGAVQPFICS